MTIEIGVGKAAADFGTVEAFTGLCGDLTEGPLAAVEEELRRLGVSDIAANVANRFVDVSVGNREIQPAVEVDIEEGAAESEAVAGSDADSGLRGNVFKTLSAETIQTDHLIVEISDSDTGCAGVVEIGDIDSHTGARFAFAAEGDASLDGSLFESAVMLVAIEVIGFRVVGDEEVGIAVVVVVADGYAHAVELDIKAGSRRYIGEGAVAIVVIEAKSTVGFLMTRPVRAIDEKDVLPTVAIIVEKGASGAESFRQELPAEGAAIVLKMDTGLACDVGKAESDGIARGGLCREGLQPRKLRPGYQSSHSSQERPAIHGTFTRPARMA